MKRLRVAILATDKRDHDGNHSLEKVQFGTAPEALLQGFAELTEAEVHVVSSVRHPVVSPTHLAPNVFYHSLVVPKIGWLRTGYQGCIRAVRRKLKEIQPDIVHGQGTERNCAMEAVFSGFPNVLTIHGNMLEMERVLRARCGSFHWWAARLENLALRRTAGVLCNSRYTEASVKARSKQTWLVPNALRGAFFSNPPSPLRQRPRVVLHVGVICQNKQQLAMLDAARKLHQRDANFEVRFLGSATETDPYVQEFLLKVREAENQGWASYCSAKSVSEVISEMDQACALVHTPISEAFGLVVAEALSRNLRVFGFSVGGVRDIVEGVEDAVVFPPGDWGALVEALSGWFQAGCPHPKASATVISQRYNPLTIAQQHLRIYQDVLGHAKHD